MNVEFATSNPFLFTEVTKRQRGSMRCPAELYLPQGVSSGIPAVVVCPGLAGPDASREYRYAQWLADNGYAALAIKPYEARRVGFLPDAMRGVVVTTPQMLADAFAALKYLARHPAVHRDRIGILGFSYGGMVALLAAYEQMRRLFLRDSSLRFAAHLSYYGCSIPRLDDPRTIGAPVLVYLAGRDANVSIPRARRIVRDLESGGSETTLCVFPRAYHQWDGEHEQKFFVYTSLRHCEIRIGRDHVMRSERSGRPIKSRLGYYAYLAMNVRWSGYWMKRNEAALKRSDETTLEFLRQNLGGGARRGRARSAASRPVAERAPRRMAEA